MDDASIDAMISEIRSQSKLFDGSHVNRDDPMTPDRISLIEQRFKIQLPQQYRRFLTTYGAGDFLYSHVYSCDPESGWSLWSETEYLGSAAEIALPFSDNGCGDYLCFGLDSGNCSDAIYWADHESDYELTPSEYEDFNDFVARVALRK